MQIKSISVPFRRHFDSSRFELKYLVEESRARGVRDFIRNHLQRDRYARPEMGYMYPIYSLYLDGPGLMLYQATREGHKNRYKLRVRYYDDNPNTPAFFEIKRRVGDAIIKERTVVRKQSVQWLLDGGCPRQQDLMDFADAADYFVLRRFCELRAAIDARPRIIVRYDREAWISSGSQLLRVSFDRKILWAPYHGQLDARRWFESGVQEVVLELKFTGRYPSWMRELVINWDLHRLPMAKYACCTEQQPGFANWSGDE